MCSHKACFLGIDVLVVCSRRQLFKSHGNELLIDLNVDSNVERRSEATRISPSESSCAPMPSLNSSGLGWDSKNPQFMSLDHVCELVFVFACGACVCVCVCVCLS